MIKHIKHELIKENVYPYEIRDFLNTAREKFWDTEFEMYTNGDYLHMEVDKGKAREELEKIVTDIDKFQAANEEYFTCSKNPNSVCVNLLVEILEDQKLGIIKYNGEEEFGQEFDLEDW